MILFRYLLGLAIPLFTICAAQASLPDYYSEAGSQFGRSHASNSVIEHIDPFSGGLLRAYDDINIPGSGGTGLAVKRTYRSQQGRPGMLAPPRSLSGYGWDIHFGRILNYVANSYVCGTGQDASTNNFVLELANGEKKVLYQQNDELITKDRWRGSCSSASDITIRSTDGTAYRFTRVGDMGGTRVLLATSIEDKYGNRISINYQDESTNAWHTLIDSVSLSGTATLSFSYYDPTLKTARIRSISGGGQSVNYYYDTILAPDQRHYLERVTRGDGTWEYTYFTSTNDNGNYTYPGQYLLKTAYHRQYGHTGYEYDFIAFDVNEFSMDNTVISKRTQDRTYTWSYGYAPGSPFDVTTITGPGYRERYEHFGSRSGTSGNVWKIGLLNSRSLYSGSTLTQDESYTWSNQTISSQSELNRRNPSRGRDNDIYAPILTTRDITRDGTRYRTSYSSFDSYGFPRSVSESGNDSRQSSIVYYTNTSLNIAGIERDITYTSASTHGNASITRTMNSRGDPLTVNHFGIPKTFTYFADGDVSSIRDARGAYTNFADYYRGVPQSEQSGFGTENLHVIRRIANSLGLIESETFVAQSSSQTDVTTGYRYNSAGLLTNIITPRTDDSNISISYAGSRRTLTRGAYTETRDYDSNGSLLNLSSHGISVQYRTDAFGRRTFQSYPNMEYPNGTRYAYDALGRLDLVSFPDSSTINYEYLSGNITQVTDQRGNTTRYTYVSYGNPDERFLVKIEAPEGVTIDIGRDKIGNIWSVSQINNDGRRHTRTYHRNAKFLVDYLEEPELGSTSAAGRKYFSYDDAGYKVSEWLEGESPTTFAYDKFGRIKNINYPGDTYDRRFSYDRSGKADVVGTSIPGNPSDPPPGTIGVSHPGPHRFFVYDQNGKLIEDRTSFGFLGSYPYSRIKYEYNDRDALSATIYPDGTRVEYEPDLLGRPTKVGDYVNSISYHPDGRPEQITYANGMTTTLGLDGKQRVDDVTTNLNGVNLLLLDYGYDPNGNITSITDDGYSDYFRFGYDRLNRLTHIDGVERVRYDRLSNIISKTSGGLALTYGYDTAKNRLSAVTDASTNAYQSYTYSARGNVIADGKFTYQFNNANELVSVNNGEKQFTYDGLGNRIREIGNDTVVTFYSKGGQKLFEYNATQGLTKKFIYLGHSLVAIVARENIPSIYPSPR